MAFSSQGDRIALTQIEQMIDGQYRKLGYYDTQADNLTWLNMEKWSGGKVSFCINILLFFCMPAGTCYIVCNTSTFSK